MEKAAEYYANKRLDLIRFVPEAAAVRVLEVGCGTGATGAEIKRLRGKDAVVVGVELFPKAAREAEKVLDRVYTGDVEKLDLPYVAGYFDAIIYGDVLEHLIDPWGLLERHAALVRHGGLAIASIPNAAHYRIVRMLRKKEWNYTRSGIMDVTHLRFFTIKTIREMFEGAGFEVVTVDRIISASRVRKFWNTVFRGALDDDLAEQYLIVARKI